MGLTSWVQKDVRWQIMGASDKELLWHTDHDHQSGTTSVENRLENRAPCGLLFAEFLIVFVHVQFPVTGRGLRDSGLVTVPRRAQDQRRVGSRATN